ncbi:MAG: hypothetical protein Q7K28_00005, partial [Candidatus Wildermuthbacteria bacterium]|nr:hypothetical protein [Candidatus Wildermuthbacteria bacterium]
MRGKLKKLFHKLFSNKKALLFSLGLVLFLSLAPLQSARAENPLSALVGFFTNIWAGMTFGLPLAIITGVLYVGAFGALVVSALLSSILKSIIEASLNISVLPGGPYNVVNVGWQFSQGLVNILFILILAFIGLATILRLQTYQMQKTLPSLIIIAILVNFSGVLVGFVVDIANLFTHFFISPIGGWNLFADGAAGLGKDFANSFVGLGANVFATGSIFIPAIKAAAFLFYFLSLSLAFLATMLLFIVRVGVLWILTILAPLAFASYILPSTKKFWTQWWQQLIQWSIIGIPMALFLYLSQLAVGSIQILPIVNFNGPSDLASSNLALASTIGSLTGPIIALLFIVVGMMISVQMAPAGAKSIMQWGGKKGLKWLAKRRPVQLALGAAAGGAAKLLSEGVKGGPHWFEQGKWKNTLGGKVGGAPLRWLSRQGENLAVPRLTQYAAKQRKFAMPTGWEQMDTQEKERNVSSTGIREDRLVKASKMKDEGSFQKTSGEFRATIIEDTKKFLKTNRDGTYEVDPH